MEHKTLITVTRDSELTSYPVQIMKPGHNIEPVYLRLPKGLKFVTEHVNDDNYDPTAHYYQWWTCMRLDNDIKNKLPGWIKKIQKLTNDDYHVYVIIMTDLCFIDISCAQIMPKYIGDYDEMRSMIQIDQYYAVTYNTKQLCITDIRHFTDIKCPCVFKYTGISYSIESPQSQYAIKSANMASKQVFKLLCEPVLTTSDIIHYSPRILGDGIIVGNSEDFKELYTKLTEDAIRIFMTGETLYNQANHPAIDNFDFLEKYAPKIYSQLVEEYDWLNAVSDFMKNTNKTENRYSDKLEELLKRKDQLSTMVQEILNIGSNYPDLLGPAG